MRPEYGRKGPRLLPEITAELVDPDLLAPAEDRWLHNINATIDSPKVAKLAD
jgi:hypothetical protein